MKVAVIYFSLEGNTKYVAEKIGNEFDSDTIQLVPVKKYPTGKVSKFIWGGKSAKSKESPELEGYEFDSNNYDLILLGTPVWAGTFAPPLRTFLKENKINSKKVAIFACSAGGPAEKCFKHIEDELVDCTVLSTFRITDPLKKNKDEDIESIIGFCEELKKSFIEEK